MKPIVLAITAVAVIAAGAVWMYASCPSHPKAVGTTASNATAALPETQSCAPGTATGRFDAVMSGACQYSCAAKVPYQEADLVAQPGAVDGRLTRCPVSGVVFQVDPDRPRVELAGHRYIVCCGTCAGKLRKDPARFLKS